MAVDRARWAVGCPSGVTHGDLSEGGLCHVDRRLRDEFSETCDFADFLEKDDIAWFVAIDAMPALSYPRYSRRARTVTEDFADGLTILKNEVGWVRHGEKQSEIGEGLGETDLLDEKVAVGEYSTHDCR